MCIPWLDLESNYFHSFGPVQAQPLSHMGCCLMIVSLGRTTCARPPLYLRFGQPLGPVVLSAFVHRIILCIIETSTSQLQLVVAKKCCNQRCSFVVTTMPPNPEQFNIIEKNNCAPRPRPPTPRTLPPGPRCRAASSLPPRPRAPPLRPLDVSGRFTVALVRHDQTGTSLRKPDSNSFLTAAVLLFCITLKLLSQCSPDVLCSE